MKINFLIILLVASIALNIVFIIKIINSPAGQKEDIKTSTIPRQKIKDIEGLSKEQKIELKKIIKDFKIESSEFKNQILAKRIDIIDEFSNPEFNMEDLKQATEELNKIENKLNLYFVESLGKISYIMNPEQRIKLLLKFSKHWFFIKNKKNGRRQE